MPSHAGTRPEDGRSAIRELGNVIQTLEGMNDLARGVTVNVGVVKGGTKPNVIPEEAYAEVDMRVATIADADELVPKILNLTSKTEGVSVRVTGELTVRPLRKAPPARRCSSTPKSSPPKSASNFATAIA